MPNVWNKVILLLLFVLLNINQSSYRLLFCQIHNILVMQYFWYCTLFSVTWYLRLFLHIFLYVIPSISVDLWSVFQKVLVSAISHRCVCILKSSSDQTTYCLFIYLLCHIYPGVPHQCTALFSLELLHCYMTKQTSISIHSVLIQWLHGTCTCWLLRPLIHVSHYGGDMVQVHRNVDYL